MRRKEMSDAGTGNGNANNNWVAEELKKAREEYKKNPSGANARKIGALKSIQEGRTASWFANNIEVHTRQLAANRMKLSKLQAEYNSINRKYKYVFVR